MAGGQSTLGRPKSRRSGHGEVRARGGKIEERLRGSRGSPHLRWKGTEVAGFCRRVDGDGEEVWARAPLAGGAPAVLCRREGAKRMLLDVVVRVVVLDCSGMTPDRRIRQPNSGGVRLWFSLCRWRMVMMLQGREGKATAQLETAAGAHGTGAHVFIGRGKGRG
jgi:hypothetical protein